MSLKTVTDYAVTAFTDIKNDETFMKQNVSVTACRSGKGVVINVTLDNDCVFQIILDNYQLDNLCNVLTEIAREGEVLQ